jgi:hypothetical protein
MPGLLDFLQGASNAAASNISGPVDLLGMGLRGIGVPVPQNAFLGSQWMRERGLTRDPQNRIAGLLGEAAGMSLPIAAAAKAPQIARGLLQAGENLRAPMPMNTATGGQAGAVVFHGSPHKFDKFDSSKIGTGEGSQAYGHGLYFADSKDVAKTYQPSELGSMYKVNLPDEQIARMLDWDKPWSQQPESIRKAIDARALEKFYQTKDLPVSQVLYHAANAQSPEAIAKYLNSVGVPGVRYLDKGSRTAGAGSSNYVVFPGNEGLLKILSRE